VINDGQIIAITVLLRSLHIIIIIIISSSSSIIIKVLHKYLALHLG